MGARRVDITPEVQDAHANYASAFEIIRPEGAAASPERWARAVWEDAPPTLRGFLVVAWRFGLGFRLGPRPAAGYVLGWAIVRSAPDVAVLECRSRFLTGHNIVHVDGPRITWTTLVRYERWPSRVLWPVAAVVHHRVLPYLLSRAKPEAVRA